MAEVNYDSGTKTVRITAEISWDYTVKELVDAMKGNYNLEDDWTPTDEMKEEIMGMVEDECREEVWSDTNPDYEDAAHRAVEAWFDGCGYMND